MVAGDPDNFAILVDLVEDWNIGNEYKNGILYYLVNGQFFPRGLNTSILDSELYFFVEKRTKIRDMSENPCLFDMPKKNVVDSLFNDETNDMLKFSTLTMEDNGYYFYMILKNDMIRIVGAKIIISQDKNRYSNVIDIKITKEYFIKIENKIEKFYFNKVNL